MLRLVMLALFLTLITACAPEISPDNYYAENVGQSQQVQYGKIVNASVVKVASHTESDTGTLVGATAGGTAGSAIGGGLRGNIIGALGGAVVGAIAGNKVGKLAGDQQGMQYIVRLDGGKTISIVQGLKPALQEGQRVMLLSGGNTRDRLIAA